MKLFEGKARPYLYWVGTMMQQNTGRDKFGNVGIGQVRECYVNTVWGQLKVSYSWMGKRIRIEVKEARKEGKK